MRNNLPLLLLPEKSDPEFDQLAAAWINTGAGVKKLGKYWIKDPELEGRPIAIYGNQPFAFVLAQIYEVTLVSPPDELLLQLDRDWTKRSLALKQKKGINTCGFPGFYQTACTENVCGKGFPDLRSIHAFHTRHWQ